MHGRPRNEPPTADPAKSAMLRDLQTQLLHHHHNRIYTKEALDASSKLLVVNPEIHTAWNYRKLALQHNLCGVSDPAAVKSLVDAELRVVESALEQNPKAYGAWYHRKWLLKHEFSTTNFEREFRLLGRLQKMDARNFHGWNYRRFVASLNNVPEEEELKYTMDMIDSNFSNYSAWHNRSVLLSNMLKRSTKGLSRERILSAEYELVHDALFTEASDQSGWFYHLWLLDQTITPDEPLLVSSWPAHLSRVILSINRKTGVKNLCPYKASYNREAIPIILYFNQAVEGVNSTTVTANPISANDENICWRPLSLTSTGACQCWGADFRIPDFHSCGTETYSVDINVVHSQGITSSKGPRCISPLKISFTLEFSYTESEHTEGESLEQLFNWHDDDPISREFPEVYIDKLKIMSQGPLEAAYEWQLETLSNEVTIFKDSPDENNCKFVKLALARLLVAYNNLASDRHSSAKKVARTNDILKLFDELIQMDPSHASYYEDQRSLIVMDQKTSDKADSALSTRCSNAVLRLVDLSLTRIGFVQCFLWVQTLDLSQNALRSIAGIEALQLLTCLNMSKNQISSFAALGPIRLLSSLRVLDVSFNRIGAHPIDTNRHLCSSPLADRVASCAAEAEGLVKEVGIEYVDYWEPILAFSGLHLTQLRVEGNPAAAGGGGDVLKVLLKKLLPALVWLDSQKVQAFCEM